MPRCIWTAAAVIALGVLAGAARGQATITDLVGEWEATLEVDETKVRKLFEENGIAEEQATKALEQITQQLEGVVVTLTIKAEEGDAEWDGTATTKISGGGVAEKEVTSKWKLMPPAEGTDSKKMQIKSRNESNDTEQTVDIEFNGRDKFTLVDEEIKKSPIKEPTFRKKASP